MTRTDPDNGSVARVQGRFHALRRERDLADTGPGGIENRMAMAEATTVTGFGRNWLETTGELVTGEQFHPQLDQVGDFAVQTILSSPETGSSTVRIMYYLSIVCARRSIYIANPYFIPDSVATSILIEAKQRGVDVKIMVAGIHNDMRTARYSSIELCGKFLKAGIV
jgi:cardiolipin synthase